MFTPNCKQAVDFFSCVDFYSSFSLWMSIFMAGSLFCIHSNWVIFYLGKYQQMSPSGVLVTRDLPMWKDALGGLLGQKLRPQSLGWGSGGREGVGRREAGECSVLVMGGQRGWRCQGNLGRK